MSKAQDGANKGFRDTQPSGGTPKSPPMDGRGSVPFPLYPDPSHVPGSGVVVGRPAPPAPEEKK